MRDNEKSEHELLQCMQNAKKEQAKESKKT